MDTSKKIITAEDIVKATYNFLKLPDPDKISPKVKQIVYKKNYKAHHKQLKEMIQDYAILNLPYQDL